MLDEKDLQAIAQIMDSKIKESEHRTAQAIRESEQRTAQAIRESEQRTMQGASTLMESYFEPKFKLLFENQPTMMENLTPKSRVDELEEEVAFLRSMIRQHSREIEALKHACRSGKRQNDSQVPYLLTHLLSVSVGNQTYFFPADRVR